MEVLIAEDESAIREVEVVYLNRAGYHTTEAINGQAALDAFQMRGADMVLIDINMPLLDGLELCRQIRRVSMVPILIVTAKDGDDDELEGLAAGADDYIKKPFNPQVLVARVDALLRRHSSKRLVYGDLVIDPSQVTVLKKGEAVKLTATQFNILLALASRPNAVMTRDQLIEHAYADPSGHDIYDRTIDAHIKSIRKAIEDDANAPQFVQTVIGQGYKFNAGSV